MVSLLIALLILAVIVIFAVWLIDYCGIPHPFNMILKIVIALIGLLYLLQRFGGDFGVNL